VARGTELGLKAKEAMNAGQLVSDEIVLGLIRERLSRPDAANGFILDGYPRNADQATALNQLLGELGQPINAVLLLEVKRASLIERLAGRRVCPKCGKVFNVASLPAGVTTCDVAPDHGDLIQRPDDKEEVIAKRLEVYEAQTRPLIEHYANLGLLRKVAGEGDLDKVFARMEAAALGTPRKPAVEKKVTAKPAPKAVKKKPASKKKIAKKAAKKPVKKSAKKLTKKPTKKPTKKKAAAKRKSAKKQPSKKPAAKKRSVKKKAAKKK